MGIQLDNRGDSKMVVEWINGKARQRLVERAQLGDCPETTARMVELDRHYEKNGGRSGSADFP